MVEHVHPKAADAVECIHEVELVLSVEGLAFLGGEDLADEAATLGLRQLPEGQRREIAVVSDHRDRAGVEVQGAGPLICDEA